MTLRQLKIFQFRNFNELTYRPHPYINFIVGPNGSGKTNLLEAIYHLGTGKSFRTTLTTRIIQSDKEACQIHGLIEKGKFSFNISIQRERTRPTQLQLNQLVLPHAAELISAFPLRLMNPDSFNLLIGGPKYRRQLLNWGTFHVEHTFLTLWRSTKRIIKQRNLALKKNDKAHVNAWNQQLILCADQLVINYRHYFQLFEPVFQEIVKRFLPQMEISLKYYPGWDTGKTLMSLLEENYLKDQRHNRTHAGPHRADLRIRVKGIPAKDILSRGQQKLLICALLLSQGILLKKDQNLSCAYLLDDLASELDENNFKRICELLETTNAQIFVTSVDETLKKRLFKEKPSGLFHVEQFEPTV
ncbi:MAG: hypothetical protein A3B69_05620 [Gammaproteobacteria bacterium RIFCSPHIGHO2_02_FULL_38_33]|nr:MAG: hypothetical protein A3B69_05620 [Gammaproteobacteria bacterium RIFCSPHIGHO2_02_FULL_38_33]OGT24267.1 MAG: hypothetical protein A2W47_05555 [Gammaproteobacteria bacterium RIFCSPHIGHO2_12_38_15]